MYKLPLSLLVIVCLSLSASAQFSKGNLLLGGTLSYAGSSSKYSGNEETSHGGNFNVSLGKAINENSVFGINLGYSFDNSSFSPGQVSDKNNGYSIGVFYRKYKSLGKDFYFFGEANAGYDGSSSSGTDNMGNKVSSGTGNGGHVSFYPGIDYKISNKFFLEISLPNLFLAQFSNTSTTNAGGSPPDTKYDHFTISTSLRSGFFSALGIGFRLIL